jgi:protein TonB
MKALALLVLCAAGSALLQAQPRRISVPGAVQERKLIERVAPVYPSSAKTAHIHGIVRFSAIIAADGTVKKLDLISGHPLLRQAAIEAVRQWVYKPTYIKGAPVEVATQIEVGFVLPPDINPQDRPVRSKRTSASA